MSGHSNSEANLRQWLADEDWYTSGSTRRWLERTPPDAAAEMLAHIAEDAHLEPPAMLRSAFLNMVNIFSISGQIGNSGLFQRKAGIRAALLLANLGDARSLPPLVRVFTTDPKRQSRYHELIEQALTRFLSSANRAEAQQYAAPLRDLVKEIWQSSSDGHDLSRGSADLLVAALGYLHALGGETNTELVRSIANAPAVKQNRGRVKETGQLLLGAK